MQENHLFWAEGIASEIKGRKTFHFSGEEIPSIKKWALKSSSSLSGVLHVGRLSDLIRGEAVSRALEKQKFSHDFIYVTEDMDPLRKVPEGVPRDFEQFIGMPVSDVPDPFGCHGSYAEHFVSAFFEVLGEFMFLKPKIFSMREEYRKGNFNDSIRLLLQESARVHEIIESKQDTKLEAQWSPWKPICKKCGKLQTTVLTKVDGLNVEYKCQDYKFEKNVARGCGFEGKSDLRKADGKLIWKSEWAAQWKRWKVCSEGAGKEYEAKNSAFWVNAEICEKVLHFPMPVPIFYEHLMVDGKKMSASVGNVVYPKEWAEVSRPETLKYLFMKRIMKSRSFSWQDIPNLELELDRAASEKGNSLVEYSAIKDRKILPIPVDYSTLASLVPLFKSDPDLVKKLSESGLLEKKTSGAEKAALFERIGMARKWVEKYAPSSFRLSFLEEFSQKEKSGVDASARALLPKLAEKLPSLNSAEKIQKTVFELAKKSNVNPKLLFRAIYLVLTGRESGPKAGLLILALGKERCLTRFKEAAK